jgi:microcystin-dependent protein
MANENRLKVEITKSGFQAAIDNSRDEKGFKIKISEAIILDKDNKDRGRFNVVGKNIGQQQISLRVVVTDKNSSYGIKTIKLIDEYSGVDFAIISHPKGEMIDYVNPHKAAYIICNLIINSLENGTVTVVDSSTVDANMGQLEEQIAQINDKLTRLPGVNLPGNQDTSGNAATASKLFKPCKIGGVVFDGTGDIDLPGVNKPGNQNTSGNAASASKLFKPCKIGGVVFDGTKDIDLPGVNKPGNQNTTGNAATATRLQTARTINGVPFDGTQDINATPAGAVQFFAMSTAPVGWLKANGAAVSRILYANLFAAIGTIFGAGDGKNTFNLPDLRGEFLRGWDDGRGVDSGRTLGLFQVDTVQRMTGEVGNITFNGDDYATGVFSRRLMSHIQIGTITPLTGNFKITFDSAAVARTSAETRPRNTALLACIKI